MRGGFFRRGPKRFTPDKFFDPNPQRSTARISNVYTTPWQLPSSSVALGESPADHLRLGRVGYHFRLATDQLPRVLLTAPLNPHELSFKRWKRKDGLRSAHIWLFVVPSRQVVAALTLDTALRFNAVIELLEDCYYMDVDTASGSLQALIRTMVSELDVDVETGGPFPPERHQLAFGPTLPQKHAQDIVQRVIYRQDLPYRKEFSSIGYPAELNRRPGNTVAVGPYVSAVCGHQNDVENCALLSAVQAVASSTQLRMIRQAAYHAVESFRLVEASKMATTMRRVVLEELSDQLTHLELNLSHSVEAAADLGLLVPSLRIESYHAALFESMKLPQRAAIAARMLGRLDRAISSDLVTVQSLERRADENRRLRWTVAVGFVSTIAIPLTLVLGFFGINAAEVRPHLSMFDSRYLGLYGIIALIIIVGILSSFAIYLQQRHQRNSYKTHRESTSLMRARRVPPASMSAPESE